MAKEGLATRNIGQQDGDAGAGQPQYLTGRAGGDTAHAEEGVQSLESSI